MQLGMVGLGRMGGNMTERCMRSGHELVVYDRNPQTVAAYVGKGAAGATSVADLVSKLRAPKAVNGPGAHRVTKALQEVGVSPTEAR